MAHEKKKTLSNKENIRILGEQWLKNKMKAIKEEYNLSTIYSSNCPIPESFSRIKLPDIPTGLWELYGNGKICQQDSNAHSGLREYQ